MHDAAHAALLATSFESPEAIIKTHHSLIATPRSGSVRLCYKNARFVTSGPLWLAPGVRIAGSLFVRERTASPLPKPRVLDRASSSLGLHAVWGGRRSL